jgi:hypothetical protein
MKADKSLTIDGWIVISFLVVASYAVYYLILYPLLSAWYESGFWNSYEISSSLSCSYDPKNEHVLPE